MADIVKQGGYDLEHQITALLHDVLEDTEYRKEDLLQFGENVADAVFTLTRKKGETEPEYVDRVLKNHMAAVVKNADKINNLIDCATPRAAWEVKTYSELEYQRYYADKSRVYWLRFSPALDHVFECVDADRINMDVTLKRNYKFEKRP